MEINTKIKTFLLFLVFCKSLYGYEFVEILDKDIKVINSSFFISDKNISSTEALKLYQDNKFQKLPQNAKSFGIDTRDYWFGFEVISSDENFLDISNPTLNFCEFYAFLDDKLIKSSVSGKFIESSEKEIKGDKIRFELINSNEKIIYLLNIKTKNPRFHMFAFGSEIEVDKIYNYNFSLYSFTSGIFVFVLIFNLFLFFGLKDKLYLYYILHIVGLFISITIILGYIQIPKIHYLVLLALELQLIGLILFSDKFLDMQKDKSLRNKIYKILYFNVSVAILSIFYRPLHELIFISALFIFFILFYAGVKSLLNGSKFAKYYLIATGVSIILSISFTFMHKGIIDYNFFTFNLLQFALIWDVLFITLAIVYKIDLLQKENLKQEKILKLRARQDTIGSMMGNIAHQWRSPLNEVASMVASLKAQLIYSEIKKDEIVNYLVRISKSLKYLSNTVDTFQNLFSKENKKIDFNLSNLIIETYALSEDSIIKNNIKVDMSIEKNIFIQGEPNAIAQIILALIQNAKEAILEKNIKDGLIKIELKKENSLIEIKIADNGKEIKDIDLENIFEPFFTTKKKGTGLGLFLVKSIIEKNYNGEISLNIKNNFKVFKIILN